MGDWRWALRVTPVLGLIAVVLIYFTQEPARGQHEGSHSGSTSYKEDLKRNFRFSSVSDHFGRSNISIQLSHFMFFYLQISQEIHHSCFPRSVLPV